MKRTEITKWILMSFLFVWGFISFIFLAGEENPAHPLTFGQFVAMKAGALLSLYLCFLCGRWFSKKGLLPEFEDE